jgi:hypothetical protein
MGRLNSTPQAGGNDAFFQWPTRSNCLSSGNESPWIHLLIPVILVGGFFGGVGEKSHSPKFK